jgi:hypothetical protein
MESDPENTKIELRQDTLKNLNKLRKWTMFLSVTGFIFLGLIIILGLIAGTFLTAFNQSEKFQGIPDILVFSGFIVLALMNFFPVFFLFRFSKHAESAVSKLDSKELHSAIKSLKRFFISIGVLIILILSAYLASMILAGRSAAILHLLQ